MDENFNFGILCQHLSTIWSLDDPSNPRNSSPIFCNAVCIIRTTGRSKNLGEIKWKRNWNWKVHLNLAVTGTYVPMSPYVQTALIIAVWPLIPMFLNSGARIYGPCYMKGFLRKLIIRQNSERSGFATVGSCWLLASSCTVGDLSSFSLINTAQIYLMISWYVFAW